MAQSDVCPTGDQEVAGSVPARSSNISFVEMDHEMFSTIIVSLPLIQEGQLSVSGERMCTSTGLVWPQTLSLFFFSFFFFFFFFLGDTTLV